MGAGVVTLREGFEASLIVAIVLAYLAHAGRRDGATAVWAGLLSAVVVSVAFGGVLFAVGAELEGRAEAAFEGTAMLVAAALLTWMIFWMRRQARTLRHDLEAQVETALARGSTLGIALVVFVAVLREGLETALFLFGSFEGSATVVSVPSALVGLALAILLGYLAYRGSSRLDLRRFFTVTSAVLLVFAAYLVARGLHELAEGGVVPENEALLVAAFVAFAAPTLALYFRSGRRRVSVS